MAADLTPLYYVSGTAASIGAVLGGARSYYSRQRKRWTDEGARSQRNAEALEGNTEAAHANTAAITRLADKLDAFAEETRNELRAHTARIERLEDYASGGSEGQFRPRR